MEYILLNFVVTTVIEKLPNYKMACVYSHLLGALPNK